jgi:hypothetical protein
MWGQGGKVQTWVELLYLVERAVHAVVGQDQGGHRLGDVQERLRTRRQQQPRVA